MEKVEVGKKKDQKGREINRWGGGGLKMEDKKQDGGEGVPGKGSRMRKWERMPWE